MATRSNPKLVDDLITFLGDPMLEIPIKSFMDENCLLFDPLITMESSHHDVFNDYGKLIKSLIEGFCLDTKVTYTDAMLGISHLISTREMREVFYDMTEPILAATDFDIFSNLMTRHNILIQEQVLRMMLSSTGALPDSLQKGSVSKSDKPSFQTRTAQTIKSSDVVSGQTANPEKFSAKQVSGQQIRKASDSGAATKSSGCTERVIEEDSEDQILREVFSKSRTDGELASHMKDKDLRNVAEQNVFQLQRERTKLEEDMKLRVVESKHVVKTEITGPLKSAEKPPKRPVSHETEVRSINSANDNLTASQAADNWMKSALSESHSANLTSVTRGSAVGVTDDEKVKERMKFMREQRDKLLAMKRKEREKQLDDAAQSSRSEHPQTSQAARRALEVGQASSNIASGSSWTPSVPLTEKEKQLAARRAVAEKLKAEVVKK